MTPLDARAAGVRFYELPESLEPHMIDPLIWPVVKKINDSGFVWTSESCQGHPDAKEPSWANNTDPMLRLVCPRDRVGQVMAALIDACERVSFDDDSTSWTPGQSIKIFPHTEDAARRKGWAELLVYLPASAVWSRDRAIRALDAFADALLRIPV